MVQQVLRVTMRRRARKMDGVSAERIIEMRDMASGALGKTQPWPGDIKVEEVQLSGDGADCRALWIDAENSDPDKVIYYLHGGGYIACAPDTTHRDFLCRLARSSGMRIFAPDYRKAPENPFPAAIEDAVAGWDYLMAQGYGPENIGIGGDSAGGGLTFGTLLKLRDTGRKLPVAAVTLSPWADLEGTGDSMTFNANKDMMIPAHLIPSVGALYAQNDDTKDPYASPYYAEDLTGLPPMMIHVSSTEVLLSDSLRMSEKLKAAGVPVRVQIWNRQLHVWHALARIVPEGRKGIHALADFFRGHVRGKAASAESVAQAAE